MKFGRLRTKDGHFISSYCIKQNNDIVRNNYYVAVSKIFTYIFVFIYLLILN